ncbi:ZIP family metal transporter [Caldisalinibacter kiritimatiensis]|uniref:Zinc transporter, ZIP family n=1 Tax=Caldisalinibacter kiritimatiensis TaxID=1304284 RepID=R1AYI6_9FIRM|nr:ZIP family metal transporter [Caldisalinibacter kiritimatiensis]EOD01762.1 Zinc transporter, ZIP family [Caldisalinibacter kiritimatiensis]
MDNVFATTIIGFIVGIAGTGLGGIVALSIFNPNDKFLGMLLGATAGLMLAVVTFDLLPESYSIGGLWIEIVGLILGILLVFIIEDFIPESHISSFTTRKESFLKTGIIMGIGIAIHNLPEGLAVGSGFMFTREIGIKMALIIALHDLPEGIAMATPLRISGFSKLKVLLLTLISGIPTGIGAFIGAVLGSVSQTFIALCMSFAGGTMLYITCGEIIPNSKTLYKGRSSTVGLVIGFIIGIIITVKL